MMDNYDLVNGL
ncbi:hypothetical protein ASZ78_003991, partial [Callipepla squamata]